MNPLKKSCDYILKNNLTIATAESLTGGLIASMIVDVPGISKSFNQGFITYSNEAKHKLLGVREKTLAEYGAVSKQTAREMAKYVRDVSKSDIGLASTGIAGPTGGSPGKPVGLCYVSCAIGDFVITRKFIFKGSRRRIRNKAADAAFWLLYSAIKRYGK